MTTYTACFRGKKRGAFGTSSYFNVAIEADTIPEAELKLYETHEHIDRPAKGQTERILWLWPGKQTVCTHKPEDVARCGQYYVSTYNGETWRQTNCNDSTDIEQAKAEHLADTAFMNRHEI